jgi:hypothetical protein
MLFSEIDRPGQFEYPIVLRLGVGVGTIAVERASGHVEGLLLVESYFADEEARFVKAPLKASHGDVEVILRITQGPETRVADQQKLRL